MKTKKSHPIKGVPDRAAKRAAEIVRLYERMRDLLDVAIGQLGTPNAMTPKSVLNKLAELETVHLSLLKVEEKFHEKHANKSAGSDIDYDAVRADLGRQLDRIRAAIKTNGVSKDA